LPLIGHHQIQNCILAIDISKFILNCMDDVKLNRGLSKLSWRGRLERLSKNNIYYDVAHNYDGIKTLVDTVKKMHPEKKIIGLFGIKAEKNIQAICELLRKYFIKIVICQDKKKYLLGAKTLSEIFKKEKINCSEVASVGEGIKILTNFNADKYVGLIFGSHYIANEVYNEF